MTRSFKRFRILQAKKFLRLRGRGDRYSYRNTSTGETLAALRAG